MATSLCKLGAGMILLLVFVACRPEPDYPVVPHIEYVGYEQLTSPDALGNRSDSLIFTIRFEDGDGDLGLQSSPADHPDLQPPYSFLNGDGTRNPFYYNFFVETFIKQNGVFVPFPFPNPTFTYSGRFMRLSQDNRIEPLEGTLKYSLIRWYQSSISRPGTVVKFRLYITDRALNVSNVVETEEITLFAGQ